MPTDDLSKLRIDRSLDLGPLGHVAVNVDVNGSLGAGYKAGSAYATFQGGFQYQGIQGNIPRLTLDVTGPALRQIGDMLWSQVSDILTKLLKNADQWLTWLHNGIIQGAGQTAEEVGKVLANVYQLPQDVIATKTQQFLGYGSGEPRCHGFAQAYAGPRRPKIPPRLRARSGQSPSGSCVGRRGERKSRAGRGYGE